MAGLARTRLLPWGQTSLRRLRTLLSLSPSRQWQMAPAPLALTASQQQHTRHCATAPRAQTQPQVCACASSISTTLAASFLLLMHDKLSLEIALKPCQHSLVQYQHRHRHSGVFKMLVR